MKKILNFLLVICFVLTTSIPVFSQIKVVDTNVYFNEIKLEFSNNVLNIDGSTYFPMRELLNNLGIDDNNIHWDPDFRAVTIFANNTVTMFIIDDTTIIENGTPYEVTTPPIIYNNSTYLPVRPVARACGYSIHYDETTRTIYILD